MSTKVRGGLGPPSASRGVELLGNRYPTQKSQERSILVTGTTYRVWYVIEQRIKNQIEFGERHCTLCDARAPRPAPPVSCTTIKKAPEQVHNLERSFSQLDLILRLASHIRHTGYSVLYCTR